MTCNVTVHYAVPNMRHHVSGEITAKSSSFPFSFTDRNNPVVKKKKTSKLKNYCHFAAVSNLYKCCCLMELLLVALSGCSLCFRDHLNSNCLLFPSNWLPFLLITLSFTRRSPDSLAPSRYQSFSPHTLLYSRATVNSHACPTHKPIIQRKCD